MAKSPELDRARKMFEDMLASIAGPEVSDLRAAYEGLCAQVEVPEDAAVEQVDAGGVPSLLVAAPGADEGRLVVYFHGGGCVIGSAHGYRGTAYELSRASGARVLLPDYRLAPENSFPAAFEDAQAAIRWAIEQVGAANVAVGGDSAGGGLTVTATRALREAGDELPSALVLWSPWSDWACDSASHERNKDIDPIVSAEMTTNLRAAYLQNGEDPRDPRVSANFGSLEGLPRTLCYVGTAELLEDDVRRLAEHYERDGSEMELHVIEDMVHVWPAVFFAFLPEAREAMQRSGDFIRETVGAPA